ncbi:hypothetical protein ACTMU2_31430 [Cupriavidus basilensis]
MVANLLGWTGALLVMLAVLALAAPMVFGETWRTLFLLRKPRSCREPKMSLRNSYRPSRCGSPSAATPLCRAAPQPAAGPHLRAAIAVSRPSPRGASRHGSRRRARA